MRFFPGTSLVACGITLAILTGCSGGNITAPTVGGNIGTEAFSVPYGLRSLLMSGTPPQDAGVASNPFIDFAAMAKNKGNTIAISVPGLGVVDLFTAAGKRVGQLTGFASALGMASDGKGDLYVADQGNSRVQRYAAGFESPPTTLLDTGQYPYDVDSFRNGAYVATANESTVSGGSGSVSIFKGSTLQSTITSSNLKSAFFCAFDGTGNLYVDGVDLNHNVLLGEIPNATSGGTTFEQLTTTNAIGFATGIQVTTSGQIAILDNKNQAIYTYNPPSGGSLGTPTQITPLGVSIDALTFAFTKNMADLYSADDSSSGGAPEYTYPSGTPVSRIRFGGFPFGTAVIPAAIPKE